jgi:hypothetical protein
MEWQLEGLAVSRELFVPRSEMSAPKIEGILGQRYINNSRVKGEAK